MSMNPPPKDQNTTDKALQEFLDKGGKIQKIEYGKRSEHIAYNGFYGRKKKPETKKEESE